MLNFEAKNDIMGAANECLEHPLATSINLVSVGDSVGNYTPFRSNLPPSWRSTLGQLHFDLSGLANEDYALTPSDVITKRCTKCGKFKEPKEFPVKQVNGLIWCRPCYAVYRKENDHNAKYRKYYKSNPDPQIVHQHNSRAKKLGIPGIFTLVEWQEIKALYDYKCAYCGLKTRLEIDHFWPLSWYSKGFRYATNEADNIIPCCFYCNRAKQDKNPFEFLAWKNGLLQEL